MADIVNNLKGLLWPRRYVIEEKKLSNDNLLQSRMRWVRIFSVFMLAVNVMLLLVPFSYNFMYGSKNGFMLDGFLILAALNVPIFISLFFLASKNFLFKDFGRLGLHTKTGECQDLKWLNLVETLSSINRSILPGLFRMDHNGTLILANDFLVRMFGYRTEEDMVRDWNLKKIFSKAEIHTFRTTIQEQGFLKDKEVKYVRKDGSVLWAMMNCSVTKVGKNLYYDGFIIDTTEIKNNEKMLENLSLVASKTDNAVFIIDKEEKIEWVNEGFVRITGYSFDEAVGIKPGILFQGENTDPDTIRKLGEKISRGESFSGELLNYRKDGNEFWVHFTLNPILNDKKEIIKYVAVESDITERKNVEKELIKAKEQAEMSMKAKDQFLSMVSHELRTPLNAVIGMTHLMLQEHPRNDQLQSLKTIKTSGEYLLALINDILDFSKIEAGKISIDHTNFGFRSLIGMLEQTFYYLAKEKNIRFFVDIGPEVPNALVGDPIRLNQILVNLIGNSIKFTDNGSVKLIVRCLSDDENNIHLKFTVSDTGIGIPSAKLHTIFERFEQVVDSNKRGGTGLGLAITKSLVELMGGSINVESELNVGSDFTFDLYFGVGDESLLEDAVSHSYNIIDDLSELRILLVEDNKINQLVAAKFLKQWKVNYDIADNGERAIELATAHRYDMILMDLQMPVMDGLTASREIRKLPGCHFVPIIALTAASIESKDHLFMAGMNDFLIKPFNPIELYNKIKKYSMSDKKEPSSRKRRWNEMELDITGIQRISDGDPLFMLELLNMCLQQFEKFPRQLLVAVREKDIQIARSIIHKVSPSIKMLQHYLLEKSIMDFNKFLKEDPDFQVVEAKANELIDIILKVEKMLTEKVRELNEKLFIKEPNTTSEIQNQ